MKLKPTAITSLLVALNACSSPEPCESKLEELCTTGGKIIFQETSHFSEDHEGVRFGIIPRTTIMNPDGSQRFTTSFYAGNPSPSPTGGTIAFIEVDPKEDRMRLGFMTREGELVYNHSWSSYFDGLPWLGPAMSWNQDGTSIVYERMRESSFGLERENDIYKFDLDSNQETRLTYLSQNEYMTPMWCGDKIVFSSTKDKPEHSDIYSMDSDGADVQRLTSFTGGKSPRCSPDRRKIVYHSHFDGNDSLWVMNIDGSNPMNVSRAAMDEKHPQGRWSPDSRELAYTSWVLWPDAHIEVVNVDNGKKKIMTFGETSSSPHWSPDGRLISYLVDQIGEKSQLKSREIKVMDLDENESITVFKSKRWDYAQSPIWTP